MYKTRELSRSHIEHLHLIGYYKEDNVEELMDYPYLILAGNKITGITSAQDYRSSSFKVLSKERVLKLRPEKEKKEVKTMSKKEQLLHKLLATLNNQKNSGILGYDVSWTIQKVQRETERFEILPISPYACGSISMKHLEIILDFAKKNTDIHPTLSYTNYNQDEERYGTSKPCIYFY
jgi:hypothetical protein